MTARKIFGGSLRRKRTGLKPPQPPVFRRWRNHLRKLSGKSSHRGGPMNPKPVSAFPLTLALLFVTAVTGRILKIYSWIGTTWKMRGFSRRDCRRSPRSGKSSRRWSNWSGQLPPRLSRVMGEIWKKPSEFWIPCKLLMRKTRCSGLCYIK